MPEISPVAHQGAPLIEHLAARVSPLHRAERLRQTTFRRFPRIFRGRPGERPEGEAQL